MKGWWGGEQGDLVVYDFIFKAIIYIYIDMIKFMILHTIFFFLQYIYIYMLCDICNIYISSPCIFYIMLILSSKKNIGT